MHTTAELKVEVIMPVMSHCSMKVVQFQTGGTIELDSATAVLEREREIYARRPCIVLQRGIVGRVPWCLQCWIDTSASYQSTRWRITYMPFILAERAMCLPLTRQVLLCPKNTQ